MRRKELERRFDNIEETLSKVGEIMNGITKDTQTIRAGVFIFVSFLVEPRVVFVSESSKLWLKVMMLSI